MAQKYNPLLKIGLQEIGRDYSSDISALQNAINSLQLQANALQTALNTLKGNKITKCFTAADLATLEDHEIFEWQGASGTVDETAFVNGHFYKKTFLPATVQVLILYHNYAYINGEYLADTYSYSHSEDPGLTQYNSTRNIDNKSVVWIGNSTPNVGDLVTISIGESSQSFVTITNKEIVDLQFQYTDSNGDVWSLNSSVYSRAITYNYYSNSQGVTINVNWNDFFDNMGFVCSDNGKLYLVRWTNYGSTGAKFDTVVNPEGSANYSATDTQSRLLNIENASNGDINITQNLNVSGDLNVTGTQRIVHTEEIDSENDFIKLRYNNPLALANDEQSGIKVENYDGNNNNCIFGVDNAGWARIGDESGTLEKIATIEENPTDAQFVQYDAQHKQLKTAAIPEATTTAAGLMSAADKVNLNRFGDDLWKDIIPTLYNSFTGSVKIIQYGRLVNIYITFTNTTNVGIKSRIMEIPILCNAIIYNYVFWCYSGDDTVPPIPILLGRQNNHITIYLAAAYNANNSYTGVFLVLN